MARTAIAARTSTMRTGSEIWPRAKAAASFNADRISPATLRERLSFVVPREAFDHLTDFLFVGSERFSLWLLAKAVIGTTAYGWTRNQPENRVAKLPPAER